MYSRAERRGKWAIFAVAAVAAAIAHPAIASDWTNWRGPNHNGTTDETDLPTEWSNTKNIRWSTTLPGPSSATPVVFGDRVFVTSSDTAGTILFAYCLDRKSGEVLWSKKLVEAKRPANGASSLCSPSPVTDGKLVYFTFGTTDLFAMDFDGNSVWSKNLQRDVGPTYQAFTYGGSPLLHKGKLYMPMLGGQWYAGASMETFTDKDSHLLCLDAASGEVLWKAHRPSEAFGESFDSYGSAVPYEYGEAEYIVLQGGDSLTGHNAETGEELWRATYNPKHNNHWRLIPTPVVADEIVVGLFSRGFGAFAVRPEPNSNIRVEDSLWSFTERTGDVPSPIYYDGRLYILHGARRTLLCVDPATGEVLWNEELGVRNRVWASPTASDGKIYCLSESGEAIVVAAKDTFEILAQNEALQGEGPVKSSIAIAHGNLFIRTGSVLYCVGE